MNGQVVVKHPLLMLIQVREVRCPPEYGVYCFIACCPDDVLVGKQRKDDVKGDAGYITPSELTPPGRCTTYISSVGLSLSHSLNLSLSPLFDHSLSGPEI